MEVTKQINVEIDLFLKLLVKEVAARSNMSMRKLVETALLNEITNRGVDYEKRLIEHQKNPSFRV